MIAMRDLLTVNRRLKLILMSAALDINLFIEYFGKCPVVHGNVSKCIAEFIINYINSTVCLNSLGYLIVSLHSMQRN